MHFVLAHGSRGLEGSLSLSPRNYLRPLIAYNHWVELVYFNRRNDILRQYNDEALTRLART